jgi:hypothetical protein
MAVTMQYIRKMMRQLLMRTSRYFFNVLLLLLLNLLTLPPSIAAKQGNVSIDHKLIIGEFSKANLTDWQEKKFDGNTDYKIVSDVNSTNVLMAISNNSASGLFKEQRIDLQKTPYLNWSWKTDKLYSGLDEKQKEGDDFVARIYIVIDGGVFIWNTKALNYVWSSSSSVNSFWPNPYVANATMFAVESGEANLGQWLSYKRHVGDDLKTVLGKEVRYIDAIAVMTDSDSSGQRAVTYYGDIYFSAD